jgi:hypothetical protein
VFAPEVLELIADTREIRIETSDGDRSYRTIMWIVVDEDEVFCRSVRGTEGKWYQRALHEPEVRLLVGQAILDATVVPADDPESIERVSAAMRRKYQRSDGLEPILHPSTLATTIRLEPR